MLSTPKQTSIEPIITMGPYNIQPVLFYGFEAWTMKAFDEIFFFSFREKNPLDNLRSDLRKRGVENKVQLRAETSVPKPRRCPKDQS